MIEMCLLGGIFPISGSILEEHDGEYHVNDNSLRWGRTERRVVIPTSQLLSLDIFGGLYRRLTYQFEECWFVEKRYVWVDDSKIPLGISHTLLS